MQVWEKNAIMKHLVAVAVVTPQQVRDKIQSTHLFSDLGSQQHLVWGLKIALVLFQVQAILFSVKEVGMGSGIKQKVKQIEFQDPIDISELTTFHIMWIVWAVRKDILLFAA